MSSNFFCCPVCKNKVKVRKNDTVCDSCKRSFPIVDEIYDFYIPESLHVQDRLTGKFFEKIFKLFNEENRKRALDTISLANLFGFTRKDFQGKKFLDAGTGYGRMVKEISGYKPEYVVGLDLATDSLKTARGFVDSKKAVFVNADLNQAPFSPETFDWVISLGVIHYIADFNRSLESLVKLCKPGGKLLIGVLGKKGLIPLLRRMLRFFTLRMPFKYVYQGLKYLPISNDLKYIISDILWSPVYHQRSFEEMEELLKSYGVFKVQKLDPYKNQSAVWRWLQGEGYMHLLGVKEGKES